MRLQRSTPAFGPRVQAALQPLGGSLHSIQTAAAACIALVLATSSVLVSSADEISGPGSGWISRSMGYLRLLDNGEYVLRHQAPLPSAETGAHRGTWIDLGYAIELQPWYAHDSGAMLRRVWFGPCEALVPTESELSQRNAYWPAVQKCDPNAPAE
jgi:hypothetical protein